MKGRIIFPKKTPGYTIVRNSPEVKDGVISNRVTVKYYNQKLSGSNRVGVLTGKIQTQEVDNFIYNWYEVQVPLQSTDIVTGKSVIKIIIGWVREDVFSFYYNNEEKQADPKTQRLAYAQSQANTTAITLKNTGQTIALLNAKMGTAKLTSKQAADINILNKDYINTIAKLKAVGGVQLQGSGLGIPIPIIIGIIVVGAILLGYGVNQWAKWSVNMKQIEAEAQLQKQLADKYLEIIASPNASQEQKDFAEKELKKLRENSNERLEKVTESNNGNSFSGIIKTVAFVVGGYLIFDTLLLNNKTQPAA